MKLYFALVTAFVIVAIATFRTASGAQQVVSAPAQAFYLDLDTPNGHFSEWRHDGVMQFSELRATIRATRLGFDLRWTPVLSLWFNSDPQQGFGLQLWRARWTAPLTLRLVRSERGQLTELKAFKRTIGLDEDVDLTVTWRRHTAVFKVGDETAEISDIPWPIKSIMVTASTGDFHVNTFQLGSIKR